MRMLIIISIVSIGSLGLIGCRADEELYQTSLLKTKWVESYEEKISDQVDIYRPGKLEDFPISWYRQVFHFGDENTIQYRILAPNDAHYMAEGSWEYLESNKIIKIYNSDAEKIYELEVVELTSQVLKLVVKN